MELGQRLDLDLLELNLFESLLIPPQLDHLLVLVMDWPLEQPDLPSVLTSTYVFYLYMEMFKEALFLPELRVNNWFK